MNSQLKKAGQYIVICMGLLFSISACKKDRNDNDKVPSVYISESEKLTIPAAVDLPANLPGGNIRVVTYYAEGVQRYKAQLKAGGTYEWVFVAPRADLYNSSNAKVGTHGAGPNWKVNSDSIYAQAFSPARTSPSPDPSAIDWLLLMPKDGYTPTGIFADVLYIQRIATKGGKAPATAPTAADQTVEVGYEAVYRFSKKK